MDVVLHKSSILRGLSLILPSFQERFKKRKRKWNLVRSFGARLHGIPTSITISLKKNYLILLLIIISIYLVEPKNVGRKEKSSTMF